MKNTVLIISGQIAQENSKVNFPDLNYPDSGDTILRTVHKIDYEKMRVQLDGFDGPWFDQKNFPTNVGFFSRITSKK